MKSAGRNSEMTDLMVWSQYKLVMVISRLEWQLFSNIQELFFNSATKSLLAIIIISTYDLLFWQTTVYLYDGNRVVLTVDTPEVLYCSTTHLMPMWLSWETNDLQVREYSLVIIIFSLE